MHLLSIACVVFLWAAVDSAAVINGNMKKAVDAGRLKYLGDGPAEDAKSGRAISYYISDLSEPRLTQNEAVISCRDLGGELVSLINKAQDDNMRSLTTGMTDHLWTAGRYDTVARKFIWITNNRLFVYSNLSNNSAHRNSSPNASQGVTIQGDLSAYAWCHGAPSSTITTKNRYICQLVF